MNQQQLQSPTSGMTQMSVQWAVWSLSSSSLCLLQRSKPYFRVTLPSAADIQQTS
jgi:hypothetical protein